MQILKLLTLGGLSIALSTTASAQFSVSGGGSNIPTSGTGGGGVWPATLPPNSASSTVVVPEAVTTIDALVIDGLYHTWVGDLQLTLQDPNGVEHLIFLRPGFLNTSNFGCSGDFTNGSYEFVETGGGALPTSSSAVNVLPGTWNQTFDSGGVAWVSGDAGVFNTPMTTIAGPAGTWTMTMYDWAGGDTGGFAGWTLIGNGGGGPGNSGNGYCSGDGSHTVSCPCGTVADAGAGCPNTATGGALLTGTGDAATAADTLLLTVTNGPANKPGIFFQGSNQGGNFNGDGILCCIPQIRYDVNFLDGSGSTTQAGFGVNATIGSAMYYQYWYRDPTNGCGGMWNFTNGWCIASWN